MARRIVNFSTEQGTELTYLNSEANLGPENFYYVFPEGGDSPGYHNDDKRSSHTVLFHVNKNVWENSVAGRIGNMILDRGDSLLRGVEGGITDPNNWNYNPSTTPSVSEMSEDGGLAGSGAVTGETNTPAGTFSIDHTTKLFFDRIGDLRNALLGPAPFNQLKRRNQRLANQGLFAGQIAFYMPNTVHYTNANEYREVALTDMAKSGLSEAMSVFGTFGSILTELSGAAASLGAFAGYPINPKIEVLFENTPQRTFQFDFLFAPTTQYESEQLRKIIKTIRAEAAPERVTIGGFIWKAPSTWDIIFMRNGVENTNIPRIQECVLEQIDVDYAPSGQWATFSNGFPTQVRLQLKFREREPNARDAIEEGF